MTIIFTMFTFSLVTRREKRGNVAIDRSLYLAIVKHPDTSRIAGCALFSRGWGGGETPDSRVIASILVTAPRRFPFNHQLTV